MSKKNIMSISVLFIFLCLIMQAIAQVPTTDTPVTRKVLVLNYDKITSTRGNRVTRLHTDMGWNNPTTLNSQYITDIKSTSGNFLTYSVAQWIDIDAFPRKTDGYVFTYDTYKNCVNTGGSAGAHCMSGVDYLKILNDYKVCEKLNNGTINEVYVFGGPYFGFYESRLAGPGAYWYNSPPLTGTTCNGLLPIMGFSYERGVTEMLHNFGHRTESALTYNFGGWDITLDRNDWDRFGHNKGQSPLVGEMYYYSCGSVHFPPNGMYDYDYSNTLSAVSNCDDWYNYPNFNNTVSSISCSAWGCSSGQYGYMKYWLKHLPNRKGLVNERLANWWRYATHTEAGILKGTVVSTIQAGIDDADSSCSLWTGNNEVYLGLNPTCSNTPYVAGLRFSQVAIPRNAVITSAYIEYTADGTFTNPLTLRIYGDASDNSPALTSGLNRITTGNFTTWSIADTWNYNTMKATPDISPVIREITKRPGWNSGNSMTMLVKYNADSGQRRFYAYERNRIKTARLVVNYS